MHHKPIITGKAALPDVKMDQHHMPKPDTRPTTPTPEAPKNKVTMGAPPNENTDKNLKSSVATNRPVSISTDDKLKLLSAKITKAHLKPVKRPLLIEQEYDPCARKKSRTQHSSAVAVKPSMKKSESDNELFDWDKLIRDDIKMDDDTESTSTIIDLTPEESPSKNPKDAPADSIPPTSDINTITNDLVVSDSDSEPEEGEILDIDIGSRNISPEKTDQVPTIPQIACEDTKPHLPKPSTSTTRLEETKNEYIPAYVTRKPTHTPDYKPTRRTGREDPNKRATVPTYQILFDLWRMVRNCDQFIGAQMEKAMLQAGYLKQKNKQY